jgi:hypothetical protein
LSSVMHILDKVYHGQSSNVSRHHSRFWEQDGLLGQGQRRKEKKHAVVSTLCLFNIWGIQTCKKKACVRNKICDNRGPLERCSNKSLFFSEAEVPQLCAECCGMSTNCWSPHGSTWMVQVWLATSCMPRVQNYLTIFDWLHCQDGLRIGTQKSKHGVPWHRSTQVTNFYRPGYLAPHNKCKENLKEVGDSLFFPILQNELELDCS